MDIHLYRWMVSALGATVVAAACTLAMEALIHRQGGGLARFFKESPAVRQAATRFFPPWGWRLLADGLLGLLVALLMPLLRLATPVEWIAMGLLMGGFSAVARVRSYQAFQLGGRLQFVLAFLELIQSAAAAVAAGSIYHSPLIG